MHTTDQLNTALDGKYAIERRIGAGGMAVVYLARDLRHNRHVALKVLNPELGAVLGPERFMAEIQVTANLHHPNLLPLFDSGEAGGLLFYAMPYVEGETLRQRLARERQLGVDEAVRLAVALAGALDYAHRHSVIHRDLKPENILLHEGQPLVMDFGIALAVSKAGGARITQTGLSLGTPQYMSPEQATGDHALDARSDIYSLGAVLYEMLVGDPPHTGSTVQAVIAKVITEQPSSVRATRPTVPDHVEGALMMALAKLPADRFTTAADFAAALSGSRPVGFSTSVIQGPESRRRLAPGRDVARARRREIVAWSLAAIGIATAATVSLWPRARAPEASTIGRFAIQLPDSVDIATDAQGARVAISRDGSRIAMVGATRRQSNVYLWSTDNPLSQVVRGTDGATTVTFSPNGEWLLFGVGTDRLLKVPITGGAPSTVATISMRAGEAVGGDLAIRTASWGDGDHIVFSRGPELWMTTPEGVEPKHVASPDTAHGINALGHPEVLPGGTHALFELRTRSTDSISLGVVSLSDGSIMQLGIRGIGAHYTPPGYIVYGQGGNVVSAVPFSLRRRVITGPPVRLLDGVTLGMGSGADVAVAHNGWMLFRARGSGEQLNQLMVFDRLGRQRPLNVKLPPKSYEDPAISPDGKHVVVRAGWTGTGRGLANGDLWMIDVESGALSLLAANAGYRPKWTRDGARITYMSGLADGTRVLSRPWDGSGVDSVNLARSSLAEIEPGPARGLSAIRTQNARDIFVAPTESLSSLRPFIVGPASETNPAISPDGKWLAYVSDETKQLEVYVRPLPGPGPKIPISIGGGEMPRWSRDGSTIFYRAPLQFMAATVAMSPTFTVVKREMLFTDNDRPGGGDGGRWDVFPNGREFLFARSVRHVDRPSLFVLVNWQRLLGKAGLQNAAP